MKTVIFPSDEWQPDDLGGKASALARLQQHGLPVPDWFVIPFHVLQQSSDPPRLPESICREISQAIRQIAPAGEKLAVRSSASEEDGSEHSFAGQFESFLNVAATDVPAKAVAVGQSAFGDRVRAYRKERGLDQPPRVPSALVQRMVNASAAGVAFGADPVSGRWEIATVSAVRGLGASLVSGEVNADTYHVDREGKIVERRTVAAPVVTDERVREIAALARRTGRVFGFPQDIEWAIEDGRLYLLQSRPITTLRRLADPDGAFNLWDNSNITESYAGITTPLTFSFARRAYEEVYRQFCRVMGVPEAVIAENSQMYRRMIGLIRGRVYYNLINWYRLIAMLPGFTFNRRFMEQMMGVKEGLPAEIVKGLEQATWRRRLFDGLNLVHSVLGLVSNFLRLESNIRAFRTRLDHALAPPVPPLEDMRPDQLATYYRRLEGELLTHWDAPIVNDFFAMVSFGVLRQLSEKWCGTGQLYNDLISAEGGMISEEPARRMTELAALASRDPEFTRLLNEATFASIRPAMRRIPEFQERYEEYLQRFGDRCLEELKLESATLHDDPMVLLRGIGRLAQAGVATASPHRDSRQARAQAEQRAAGALGGHPLRHRLFRWVLRNARNRIRERENLRFERTRLFGRARRLFVQMGHRFAGWGLLDHPQDIFYLEVEEILGFVEGNATCTNLRGLAAVRREEFARYGTMDAPERRFETRGAVNQANPFRQSAGTAVSSGGASLQGIGCSPGVVRAPVCVVHDPRQARLKRGEILVAARTDPGWVILFPLAAGLLVEYGSLLSHSAIVAREMGIPAIVSLPGITQWVKDGDWVEFDGTSGMVRRIEAVSAPDVSCLRKK